MKLRNKKTGEVVDVESLGHAASLKEKYGYQVTLSWKTEYENLSQCKDYQSLAELNEDWEDYKPIEFSKYYLMNEKTGYIYTFASEEEMRIFNTVDEYRPVKVVLDGDKYIIERL